MAAEFEELKLQVTLVDNATTQLKTLQAEVNKLGSESARRALSPIHPQ
jgi:hypothetical protein